MTIPSAVLPQRRRRPRPGERGIALVMVMGAIAVLTIMLADLQDESSVEQASAMADRDSVQAEYLARSAINLSRLLIAAEPTVRQSVEPFFMLMRRKAPQLPIWLFTDRLLAAFNDAESSKAFAATTGIDVSLGKNLGLTGGRFEVRVVDEDSKINVNTGGGNAVAHVRLAAQIMGLLAPPQYNPLFEQKDSQGQFHDRLSICAALVDWADNDESLFNCDISAQAGASANGVETGYYQLLKKPYRAKNAPYDSLDELAMVRGVSDDFWATFVDPEPENPDKRVMTVWGQGAVNVNTANAQTLLALICSTAEKDTELCLSPTMSQTFLMGVTMARGMSMGAPLFSSPAEFTQAIEGGGMIGPLLTAFGIKPVKFKSRELLKNAISTDSKVFSIYAVGVVKGYKRETRSAIQAVVDFRNAPTLQQLGAAAAGAKDAITGGASASPGSLPPTGSTPSTTPGTTNPDAIAAALRPSSGGTILYYRIQ